MPSCVAPSGVRRVLPKRRSKGCNSRGSPVSKNSFVARGHVRRPVSALVRHPGGGCGACGARGGQVAGGSLALLSTKVSEGRHASVQRLAGSQRKVASLAVLSRKTFLASVRSAHVSAGGVDAWSKIPNKTLLEKSRARRTMQPPRTMGSNSSRCRPAAKGRLPTSSPRVRQSRRAADAARWLASAKRTTSRTRGT